MSRSKITLTITQGALAGYEAVFESRTNWMIGRTEDCDFRVPEDFEHSDVSRHHCVFDIAPPQITVRDLGSRNGTYVNGENIGQRFLHQNPEDADLSKHPAYELHVGDEVQVGRTVFRVDIDMGSESEKDASASIVCV